MDNTRRDPEGRTTAGERVTGRVIERTFPVGAHAQVHINNVRGAVRLTGGSGDVVRVRLEVDPERRLPDEDIERAPIELEHDGSEVRIKVLSDASIRGYLDRRHGPPDVRIAVEAPVATAATVHSVSAEVSVGGLQGPQMLNTVSGRVVVSDVRGDIRVNTVSGDALLARLSGALRWNSVSGALTVRESRLSELRANSVSGRIEAAIDGDLAGGVQAQTVSGDLRLTVDPTFGCDAQLTSMSGSARCALPAHVTESRRGRWHAVVNGGGPTVRLSSMSGSLAITTGGPHASASASATASGPAAGATSAAAAGAGATMPGATRSAPDARLSILQQIERKDISVEEGLARLDALRQQGLRREGDS